MKILVGLSGGLDSTYAALLLKEAGHTVEGAVLDMHPYSETEEARAAATQLGIPFRVILCREAFERTVVTDFCSQYLQGRTPNPCILCNETVKFRMLYEEAMRDGFDRIATGHYARITSVGGNACVAMGKDTKKDQSYMLYRLPAEILSRLLLPLGDMTKDEIRESARARNLSVAERAESQDICFIRGESYTDFLARRCGELPKGHFISETGEVLGEHEGITHYTVGQRKGLAVSAPTRLFVKSIDPETRNIILADKPPRALRFLLERVVFSGMTPTDDLSCKELLARVRYTAPLTPALLFREGDALGVALCENTCAVTPGQSVVLYSGDTIMLGGIVKSLL
ncbi:MAG: tRNA 2-thiouridine(34) synthase MnmA [Clostridia bacterium]|nr:tRNA 2-thiouridine(34) synthase MnmA [Clostridia bacterium]